MTQREAHRDFAAHRVTNEGDRGFLCTSGPQFVGDQIGVGSQLSTGVVVVLGIRIFTNAAAIRRAVLHA